MSESVLKIFTVAMGKQTTINKKEKVVLQFPLTTIIIIYWLNSLFLVCLKVQKSPKCVRKIIIDLAAWKERAVAATSRVKATCSSHLAGGYDVMKLHLYCVLI